MAQNADGKGTTPVYKPDPTDYKDLTPEQQQIFDLGFGKGASKVETTRLAEVEAQHADLLRRVQTAEQQASMTEEERKLLRQQLADYETRHMSEEQKRQKEASDMRNTYETKIRAATEDTALWKTRHHRVIVENHLTQVAVAADAFAPEQIVALLSPNVEIQEVQEEGQPPKFIPKLRTTNTEGKTVLVDLKEGVAAYLEKNPNLSRSKVIAGGLRQSPTGDEASGGFVVTRAQLADSAFVMNPENWSKISAAQKSGNLVIREA
jgi:hypothetical protein